MKRIWICIKLVFLSTSSVVVYSQSADCHDAIELDLSEGSSSNTYTGTFTFFQDTFCNNDHLYDIWFTFVATRERMLGNVSGETAGETLDFSLFKGSCENLELLECTSNITTINFENLIVGDRYFFRFSAFYIEEIELEIIPDYFTPEYQVTKFNIPELSDTTLTQRSFREDIDGSIWLFTKNVLGNDVFMKYSGDGWEEISGPCSACLSDVVISKDGIIYLAAGENGLYQYEDEIWTQLLNEEVGSVFIDAFDQLAVIKDVGVGKVIDNQFVETNNDGFPGFQPKTEVITPENRIYLDKYEYCYEKGWTKIYQPPPATLCCQFGYIGGIKKDTNDVLHYAVITHTLSYSYASIRAFDNGTYVGVDLINNSFDFYNFVIDNDNAFWTISPETLRKDNGSFVREWPITELFGASADLGTGVYSLFVDSKANCWIINRYSGEIVVLHPEDSELGIGFIADEFQAVQLDCTTFTYDIDSDGYRTPEDCDDYNYWRNPGQTEIPYNGKDEDCDPNTPDDDLDSDGFVLADDCDDNNANINPNAEEVCDGIDNDCDGDIDENLQSEDSDEDGVCNAIDCMPNDPNVFPGNIEIPYNSIDDDCDPQTLDDDLDQDGYNLTDDCDDTDASIYVGAICDDGDVCTTDDFYNLDCICSGQYHDTDQDGVCDPSDCYPMNPNIYPGNIEIVYNGINDDCDPTTLDDDLDQDLFILAFDCDDNNPNINPAISEIPYNGIDDDCNETTMDDDLDQDGFVLAEDCDDTNPGINPDAEDIPNNGIDEDCDGEDATSSTYELGDIAIQIYPNPVADLLNIDVSTRKELDYRLYDIYGNSIIASKLNESIDVSHILDGTYILQIIDIESNEYTFTKIVVAR